MTLTYEQVLHLLPAYAIGALDSEEQYAVDEYFHLQDVLRRKLASAEAATTLLSANTEHAEIASGAKGRLMELVQMDISESAAIPPVHALNGDNSVNQPRRPIALPLTRKRVARKVDPDLPNESGDAQSSVGQVSESQTSTQRAKQEKRKKHVPKVDESATGNSFWSMLSRRAFLYPVLATSLAALLFLGALTNYLDKQERQLKTALSEIQSTVVQAEAQNTTLLEERSALELVKEQIQAENQQLQNQLAMNSDRIMLVGAASQATVMFGSDESSNMQGTFFHKDNEGALVVHGLQPLPVDQTYQFWLVTDSGEQISAGLFAVDENLEPTWASLDLPQNLPQYRLAGVSIEPATGSTAPTGPMLLESSPIAGESS